MKKLLIFLNKKKIAPTGGPYGYVYNLCQGLNKIKGQSDIQVDFVPYETDIEPNPTIKSNQLRNLIKKRQFLYPYDMKYKTIINEYDAVHFHVSKHLYRARECLDGYQGKVIFTSHSPMPYSKEMREDAELISKIVFSKFFREIEEIDRFSFQRADYITFPCKESEQPYNNYQYFEDAKKRGAIKYIISGSIDGKEKVRISRNDYRKQHNIPDNAFVVAYVGRHNTAKGYNILLDIGNNILQRSNNIFFLIAGKQKPLRGLHNKKWIEIGYTEDPYSLINASDLFVIPNKSTYFDLVLLEALSLNKPLILSDTGGNRYFKKYNTDSISFFDSKSGLTNYILTKSNDNTAYLSTNRDFYMEEFTCEKFAIRYLDILSEII